MIDTANKFLVSSWSGLPGQDPGDEGIMIRSPMRTVRHMTKPDALLLAAWLVALAEPGAGVTFQEVLRGVRET